MFRNMGKGSGIRKALARLGIFAVSLLILCGGAAIDASALTVEKTTRYYSLDTGVTFLWCNSSGVWQNGLKYGDTTTQHSMSHKWNLPSGAKVVSSGKYNKSATKGQCGYFPFQNAASDETALWSKTSYGKTKAAYDENYVAYSADMNVTSSDGANPVTYGMSFPSKAYNLKKMLSEGQKQKVYDLLGTPSQDMIDKMNLLDPSSESYNAKVQGYMYFTPTVIEYTITESIELGDLAADLSLDSSAKQGESYTVADASILSPEIYAVSAVLEKSYDKSTWESVVTWKGSSAKKGKHTGGSVTQTESNVCTVYYRITVTTDDGQTDSATKSIKITDSRTAGDFDVQLKLPDYTYVGHPVEAVDQTYFQVEESDGTYPYSAREFYSEGLGKNNMYTDAPNATQKKKSGTSGATRIFTFNTPSEEDEFFTVTLEVETDAGETGSDSRYIEVFDTPTIIDTLSGKQKTNRKQILDIKIATNPKVALTRLWVEIETEDGTERVHLDHNIGGTNALENSEHIKTRAITAGSKDEYFTNVQLLFLTKNAEARNFKYRIYAEDANGKSDLVEKAFTVAPDLAPKAALFTENVQLRNPNSDTAEITVEDRSSTDSGDELSRIWYYREAETAGSSGEGDVSASGDAGDTWIPLNGSPAIVDASFGRLKTIIHSHDGVGKLEYKVFVKDIWTDETLEEYITETDYHSAWATIGTDVTNVAPVVSLDLKESSGVKVAVVAGSEADKTEIEAIQNDLQMKLIEQGVEADISLTQMNGAVVEDDSEDVGDGRTTKFVRTDGLNYETGYTMFENENFAVDDDTFYYMKPNYTEETVANVDNDAYPQQPFEITAYDGYTGEMKWQHNLTAAELEMRIYSSNGAVSAKTGGHKGYFVMDKMGKYVFFVSSGKTAILEKASGGFLTSVDFELGRDAYSYGRYIYTLKSDGVYSISTVTGEAEKIYGAKIVMGRLNSSGDYAANAYSALIGGEVNFVIATPRGFERGYLNLKTGSVVSQEMGRYTSVDLYKSLGFDILGNVAIFAADLNKVCIFDAYNNLIKEVKTMTDDDEIPDAMMAKNEKGEFTYVTSIVNYRYSRSGKVKRVSAAQFDAVYTDASYDVYKSVTSDASTDYFTSDHIMHAMQLGDVVYFQTRGDWSGLYDSDSTYYYSHARTWKLDLATGETAYGGFSGKGNSWMNFGSILEESMTSDNLYGASWTVGGGSKTEFNGDQSAKVVSIYRTMDTVLNQSVARSIGETYQNEDKNVLVLCDSKYKENEGNLAETIERIVKNRVNVIIAGERELSGYQKSLCAALLAEGVDVKQITRNENFKEELAKAIAAASNEEKKDVYKIVKSEGAAADSQSSLTKSFTLEPDTTYYYEYSIKASDGKEKITVSPEISEFMTTEERVASGQFTGENYYVTSVEKDDFETDVRNDFFKYYSKYDSSYYDYEEIIPEAVDGAGRLIDIYYYASKSTGSNPDSRLAKVTFTIPEGKKAILSFDVAASYDASQKRSGGSKYIIGYIDDKQWNLLGKHTFGGSNFASSYTHPEILGAGEHSLSLRITMQSSRAHNIRLLIDNLTVSYIEDVEPEDNLLQDKSKSQGGDWYYHSGTITTPSKVRMYSGQKASYLDLYQTNFPEEGYVMETEDATVKLGRRGSDYYAVLDMGENYGINTEAYIKSLPKKGALWYANDYGTDGATETAMKIWLGNVSADYLGQYIERNASKTYPSLQLSAFQGTETYLETAGEAITGAHSFVGKNYVGPASVHTDIVETLYEPVAKGKYFITHGDLKNTYSTSYTTSKGVTYTTDRVKVYDSTVFMANKAYDGRTDITLSSADEEWYLADFKLYTVRNGKRVYVTEENMYDPQIAGSWTAAEAGVTVETVPVPKEEENVPVVYKKGELVMYNVYYSDYSGDPSKASYWKYTHEPWNDGAHPDAVKVIDKYGNESAGSGIVQSAPIERFYIDGKYTVEHWQYDDTGNPAYDKMSNVAKLTFYVQGDGGSMPDESGASGDGGESGGPVNTPPEVKSLKSEPAPVQEGETFRIRARVEDAEKDELIVVIEVIRDGEQIYVWRDNHFAADPSTGEYPAIVTDKIPEKAQPGKYTVVCTARDDSGIDIKTYEFKVEQVLRYGVTGSVYHTDEWEKNRKAYNATTFGASRDAAVSYAEYIRAAKPRMRGSNVFWSGERFMLSAEALGEPTAVTAEISGSAYRTELTRAAVSPGSVSPAGSSGAAWQSFTGSLWDITMNGRWGTKAPEELTFIFTAHYKDGKTAVYEEAVIVDDSEKYVKLHRRY